MREAQAVAALRHTNIVQVHDVGELDGLPYFTMEFVEGGSLAKKLRGIPQPARHAAAMAELLARAIDAAHQGGIVHRDLKPSNVLLTDDGSPKITDFGLSGRLKGDAALAARTTKAGTPSYMAPEQALGNAAPFCPAVDIYSLGAILYEMLTGRPPFHAETPSETQRQSITQDPVPPSRLNSKVPRDLETICLKCLQKDPERRYQTAGALADDLARFQRGEPILARPIGVLGRIGKWARRRPGLASLLAACLLLGIALLAILLWFAGHRAQQRQAVASDLKELADLQQRSLWNDANSTLERAEARLESGGVEYLRPRLAQARRDLDLVIKLDAIHLRRLTNGELPFYKAQAAKDYAVAFVEAGIGKSPDDPDAAAERVAQSAVRGALIAALDDWAVCTADDQARQWIVRVANIADPDPTAWRQRIREPQTWNEPPTVAALAKNVPVADQPVPALVALGERLRSTGGDAPAFLKRVQKEHPADFWANLTLGDALVAVAPVEAAGYYRAALAARPHAAVGYTSLGDAYNAQGLRDEATAYHRRAVQADPRYARGQTNLGNILYDAGKIDDAIACYEKALQADPNYAWAHFDLARTLQDVGRLDQTIEHYRAFHSLDSTNARVANILRAYRVSRGAGEEVRQEWHNSLQANPPDHDPWFGYAELCLFLGQDDEYRRARRDLLRHFGSTLDPYVAERTARAALLLPADGEDLQAAVTLAERAAAARSGTPPAIYRYFRFAQALAQYRQAHFVDSIAIMSTDAADVMGPSPRLVIAMARHRTGQTDAARKTLAAEIISFDWSLAQAITRDHWIWHVLRREAESMIFPDMIAVLESRRPPHDNTERLALLGICRFKNLTRASAGLYTDAFAADPTLLDDPRTSHRFNAASVAALAGSGLGDDAANLDAIERANWRQQARQWLADELIALDNRSHQSPPSDAVQLQKTLMRWQASPDLAPIRDPAPLQRLSPREREQCAALWNQISQVLKRAKAATQ
jgi:serine/threonine-protein kinase